MVHWEGLLFLAVSALYFFDALLGFYFWIIGTSATKNTLLLGIACLTAFVGIILAVKGLHMIGALFH